MHKQLAVPRMAPPNTRNMRDYGVFFLHYVSDTKKRHECGLFKAILKPFRHTLIERKRPVWVDSGTMPLYSGAFRQQVKK